MKYIHKRNFQKKSGYYTLFNSKKGDMTTGQIFIFITSLIVVSLILIYGFKVITQQLLVSKELELLQFRKNIESHVSSYANDFGSVGYKRLIGPSDVTLLCITSYYDSKTNVVSCSSLHAIPTIVSDSYSSGIGLREKKNVFLFTSKGALADSYYAGNITVKAGTGVSVLGCNVLCIPSSRQTFNLVFSGRGNHVDISEN